MNRPDTPSPAAIAALEDLRDDWRYAAEIDADHATVSDGPH